jgi:hypothetical protein
MARFEDLQQLWQRQPERVRGVDPSTAMTLSRAFERYGRRHDRIYMLKLAVLLADCLFLEWLLWGRTAAMSGAAVAIGSAILFVIVDWREQRSISRLNFAAPSLVFIQAAIARLEAQRDPFRKPGFWGAIAGVWIGANMMIIPRWLSGQRPWWLLGHGIATAAVGIGCTIGRWLRRRRFKRECVPLIESLRAVLETIQGEAE